MTDLVDISTTIASDSNQLIADDLIPGPITIIITDVLKRDDKSRPIIIRYIDDGNKPYLPCKTDRRVLHGLWGKNGKDYIGRKLILFRDPTAPWQGREVGGVRIMSMSHIDEDKTLFLPSGKGGKKSKTVITPIRQAASTQSASSLIQQAEVASRQGTAAYRSFWSQMSKDIWPSLDADQRALLLKGHEDRKRIALDADDQDAGVF